MKCRMAAKLGASKNERDKPTVLNSLECGSLDETPGMSFNGHFVFRIYYFLKAKQYIPMYGLDFSVKMKKKSIKVSSIQFLKLSFNQKQRSASLCDVGAY